MRRRGNLRTIEARHATVAGVAIEEQETFRRIVEILRRFCAHRAVTYTAKEKTTASIGR